MVVFGLLSTRPTPWAQKGRWHSPSLACSIRWDKAIWCIWHLWDSEWVSWTDFNDARWAGFRNLFVNMPPSSRALISTMRRNFWIFFSMDFMRTWTVSLRSSLTAHPRKEKLSWSGCHSRRLPNRSGGCTGCRIIALSSIISRGSLGIDCSV